MNFNIRKGLCWIEEKKDAIIITVSGCSIWVLVNNRYESAQLTEIYFFSFKTKVFRFSKKNIIFLGTNINRGLIYIFFNFRFLF